MPQRHASTLMPAIALGAVAVLVAATLAAPPAHRAGADAAAGPAPNIADARASRPADGTDVNAEVEAGRYADHDGPAAPPARVADAPTGPIARGINAAADVEAGLQARRQANTTPTVEQDLAAIAEFNRRYLQAINDEDIATLSSLTTDAHIMIASGRPPIVGKAANDAANGRVFAQFDIVETWTPVETVVDGNLAYQRGTFTVAATPKKGGDTTRSSGHFLRIYRRQPDGSWRMTRDMFNTEQPAARQ